MLQAPAKSANPASKASAIHVYPDASHADYRPSYRKAPAEDGWKRMAEWFKKHGV